MAPASPGPFPVSGHGAQAAPAARISPRRAGPSSIDDVTAQAGQGLKLQAPAPRCSDLLPGKSCRVHTPHTGAHACEHAWSRTIPLTTSSTETFGCLSSGHCNRTEQPGASLSGCSVWRLEGPGHGAGRFHVC